MFRSNKKNQNPQYPQQPVQYGNYPYREYDEDDDTSQSVTPVPLFQGTQYPQQRKPLSRIEQIRQGRQGAKSNASMQKQVNPNYQGQFGHGQQNTAPNMPTMPPSLMGYLQGEQLAAQQTQQLAQADFHNFSALMAEDTEGDEAVEGAERNWYAISWISVNALLSFCANLYFAYNVLHLHIAFSIVLAVLFVFVPAFVIGNGRWVWRWIQQPGRHVPDLFLGGGWLALVFASLAINWIATMSLLEAIMVFQRSLTMWAIYFGIAVLTDLPQFVYFLRNKR